MPDKVLSSGSEGVGKPPAYLYLLLSVPLYLALTAGSFRLPLIADDTAFAAAAADLWKGHIFLTHPPLYSLILGLLYKTGIGGPDLRVFGAACFMLNLFLIVRIAEAAFKDSARAGQAGLLAALLFLLNPMAVRGSLILDIDNTVLASITLWFVLEFVRRFETPARRDYAVLGGIIALGFWSKLSTPLLLLAAVFAFYWLKDGFKKSLARTFILSVIGLGSFFLSWWIFTLALDLPFYLIFHRVASVLQGGYSQRSFSLFTDLADRVARTALWAGPFFLLLGLFPVLSGIKAVISGERPGAKDFIAILALLIFFGYIAIGGVIYGFPKYHYPMLGLTALLAAFAVDKAGIIFDKKTLLVCAGLAAAWAAFNSGVVGDLIYGLNHDVRYAALLDPQGLRPALARFALHCALYLVPAFIVGAFIKIYYKYDLARAASLTLLLGAAASAVSLGLAQARAGYSTTYLYGSDLRDRARLAEFLGKVGAGSPGSLLIAPEDVMYNAGLDSAYPYCTWGKTAEKFAEAVSDKKVACVVYGPAWNSAFQYKSVFPDPSVRKVLLENYSESAIGEYTVWLKKQ